MSLTLLHLSLLKAEKVTISIFLVSTFSFVLHLSLLSIRSYNLNIGYFLNHPPQHNPFFTYKLRLSRCFYQNSCLTFSSESGTLAESGQVFGVGGVESQASTCGRHPTAFHIDISLRIVASNSSLPCPALHAARTVEDATITPGPPLQIN